MKLFHWFYVLFSWIKKYIYIILISYHLDIFFLFLSNFSYNIFDTSRLCIRVATIICQKQFVTISDLATELVNVCLIFYFFFLMNLQDEEIYIAE